MARLVADNGFKPVTRGVILGVFHQMQDHARAMRWGLGERQRRNRIAAFAIGRPFPRLVTACPTGQDIHAVRHHEGRIKAHAKLANQRGVFAFLGGFDFFHKGFGARTRNGAQMLDKIRAAHADAIILDAQAVLVGINADGDLQALLTEQFRLGHGFIAQLFTGIRRIGNQLAQKHILIGIDRMDHHMQQFGDIRLEAEGFWILGF